MKRKAHQGVEPTKVALRRADFVEQVTNPTSVEFLSQMVAHDRVRQLRFPDDRDGGFFPAGWTGADVADRLRFTASVAELYTATPEMFDLIWLASQTLPPQVLSPYDLPSPSGFLALPAPLTLLTELGTAVKVCGLMWSEASLGAYKAGANGVVIYSFADLLDASSDAAFVAADSLSRTKMLAQGVPRDFLIHVATFAYDQTGWEPVSAKDLPAVETMSSHPHILEEEVDGVMHYYAMHHGHKVEMTPQRGLQFLKAFFHFCTSTLTMPERVFPSKGAAKYIARLGLPPAGVTTIQLRRVERGKDHGSSGRALHYRHVRRGFWRKQWVGSDTRPEVNGPRRQQHTWINPTIVGPDGAPFSMNSKVNAVVR